MNIRRNVILKMKFIKNDDDIMNIEMLKLSLSEKRKSKELELMDKKIKHPSSWGS